MTTPPGGDTPAATPFHDLDAYVALPRLSGLVLSPDGSRLVTAVQTLDRKRTAYVTALWEVDPSGERPARRLTRSAKSESSAAFTPAGDLLFTSARPDPDATEPDDEPPAALWLLPADGAEARVVADRRAGIGGVRTAKDAPTVLVVSDVLPSASDPSDDDRRRKERKEAKVAAILHTGYPVRYWDHDLGPGAPHAFVATVSDNIAAPLAGERDPRLDLSDVTPGARHELHQQSPALSPDGRTVVTPWNRAVARGEVRTHLVAIDVATGDRRVLVEDADGDLSRPVVSPDGQQVVYLRESISTPHRAPALELWVVPLAGGEPRRVAGHWDRWAVDPVWLPTSDALLVVADDDGRSPVFHVELATDTVTRVTSDDAAFTDVRVSPDGRTAYALRSSYAAPAAPVRIDLAAALAGGPVAAEPLRSPAPEVALPGRLDEVVTTAEDGTRVRAWLALPDGAGPDAKAPLLLWIHGGPLGSWNAWSWRWNPWLLVAQGYAVLLPDPALSTGYGQEFVQRGWGAWGAAPYTDLMAATDAALERDDVDPERTAAMGGSFGGYMANWVAGHTDRFRAIVTHASLWALDQFGPTTDASYYWQREMTPEMALSNSPHRFVGDIVTPMLVVHGDKDYRVPIGEGLRLWYELLSASGLPADEHGRSPHRFLYYPDENHWVLKPQHAKVWYGTVAAFLAEHVLGRTGDDAVPYPELLG
ncbi:peptidase S9 prolyl oligopeptidase active site domain protein [Cellulomonas flavigena DSM 20109]|uniref:Peptidase S9 prolyl oligopeptidase active site domain protein n=1 Tax=Cellulomonas flavigena (strain ATCC 482 / DSM 20109 / BCRC 11376 / JCM 18109 / NBRC 3775 / NCIMB 8073 / NRS 134) TaxID=446466 RepID=D5UG81_CELFN|nr:alpha/beta fold hydrolase [Cellulomonas flavigena]ADG73064.1 peptidase S9 prolyl oligopeptidase active site domain protein [Cellulomonas flavigena DSM 20109]